MAVFERNPRAFGHGFGYHALRKGTLPLAQRDGVKPIPSKTHGLRKLEQLRHRVRACPAQRHHRISQPQQGVDRHRPLAKPPPTTTDKNTNLD